MSDNGAVMEGYTREVHLVGIARELFLLVKPETDLGVDFRAWDTDNQEFIMVHGYQWRTTYDSKIA
jgi:hypothetical protein